MYVYVCTCRYVYMPVPTFAIRWSDNKYSYVHIYAHVCTNRSSVNAFTYPIYTYPHTHAPMHMYLPIDRRYHR